MKRNILIINLYIVILSGNLFADSIYLSNSNVIKGTIVSMDNTRVKIETPNGVLEVEKSKIVRGEFFGEGDELSGDLVFEFLINGSIKDSSGNGYKVKTKSIPYATDILNDKNGALLSKGEGEYFYIENSRTISEIDEFTIAMNFFPDDTTDQRYLLSNWHNTFKDRKAEGRFSLSVQNRTIVLFVVDSKGYYQSIAATEVLNLKEWNSIAIRFGLGEMSIYVNGDTVAKSTIPTQKLLKGEWPLYFMTAKFVYNKVENYKKYNIKGKLDKIKMFDSTLSDNELNLLYKL